MPFSCKQQQHMHTDLQEQCKLELDPIETYSTSLCCTPYLHSVILLCPQTPQSLPNSRAGVPRRTQGKQLPMGSRLSLLLLALQSARCRCTHA